MVDLAICPVISVVEDLVSRRRLEEGEACDPSSDDTSEEAETNGESDGSQLEASLLRGSSNVLIVQGEGSSVVPAEVISASGGNNSGGDATNNAWQTEKILNTASIMNPFLLLEPGLQITVSEGSDGTSNQTNKHGPEWHHDDVGIATHSYTTSKGGIKDDFQLKLSKDDLRPEDGCDHTCSEGKVSVDDGSLLMGVS